MAPEECEVRMKKFLSIVCGFFLLLVLVAAGFIG
jgi:hypothetical protein